jgi:putative ABC transport system permease protein
MCLSSTVETSYPASRLVRPQGDERSVMTAVGAAVKQLDRNLAIERLTAMRSTIDESIYTDRLMATLAIAFGVLAATLAAAGLYGTISYAVARRTRAFGRRLALGATPESLLLPVMCETGWPIAVGVAVGLPASVPLACLAQSEFYGIRSHDPWVIGGATPAVRAMRIEPVRALR